MLVNGEWKEPWRPHQGSDPGGSFVRQVSGFRNWVTPDGSAGPTGESGFPAEAGRYHLYVALTCPWASRTLIARALKGLRAARLGLPMSLAIIGGNPTQFVPFADHYRDLGRKAGFEGSRLQVGISSNGFIADTSQSAADIFYPSHAYQMNQLRRERGWGAMTRPTYEAQRSASGALAVGSPQ